MTSKRTKKCGGRRRRRQGGGGKSCGCTSKDPLPVPAWEPPGGMWKPGKVNGLNGGYYYGVQVGQGLPDPISPTNYGGGGHMLNKKRRQRRKTHRRRKKQRRRRRKTHRRHKKRRRKTRRRRRRQRGGSLKTSVMGFINTVVPNDLLDLGYRGGHELNKLWTGFKGEVPAASPNVLKQPIGRDVKIISRAPPKMVGASSGDYIVNTRLTPQAQAGY